MLVDLEIRERLGHYCEVTQQTQEKAANQALRELLARCEKDPAMKAQMDRMKGLKQASGELVTGLRISIDLEDDEIVLLIRLLLKHVIEFQEGDWRILTPFESRLIRKLESVRQDAIKSLNQGRNHNANEPDNSRSQNAGIPKRTA
jgi:hypothetical protein